MHVADDCGRKRKVFERNRVHLRDREKRRFSSVFHPVDACSYIQERWRLLCVLMNFLLILCLFSILLPRVARHWKEKKGDRSFFKTIKRLLEENEMAEKSTKWILSSLFFVLRCLFVRVEEHAKQKKVLFNAIRASSLFSSAARRTLEYDSIKSQGPVHVRSILLIDVNRSINSCDYWISIDPDFLLQYRRRCLGSTKV